MFYLLVFYLYNICKDLHGGGQLLLVLDNDERMSGLNSDKANKRWFLLSKFTFMTPEFVYFDNNHLSCIHKCFLVYFFFRNPHISFHHREVKLSSIFSAIEAQRCGQKFFTLSERFLKGR